MKVLTPSVMVTVALDAATVLAWLGSQALMAHILNTPHPAWLGLFLLSQGLLLYALWQLRRIGSPLRADGLGKMALQLFVALQALVMPFATAAVMSDIAGITEAIGGPFGPAPYEGAAWQLPLSIGVFAVAFVYPLALAWTLLFQKHGVGWEDPKQVARAERWNTLAVNLNLLLFVTFLDQRLGIEDGIGALLAIYLMVSLPRLVWVSVRFHPVTALSALALLVCDLVNQILL